MRIRPWIIASLLLTPVVVALGVDLYYEKETRPATLRKAGKIELEPLVPDLSIESALPPASGSENAALYYVQALNRYYARWRVYSRARMMGPYAPDVLITEEERRALLKGARQRSCDFYAPMVGSRHLLFNPSPTGRPWSFEVTINPMLPRIYVDPLRALAQAALTWAKHQETHGNIRVSESLYLAETRLGYHLSQHPGALMDMLLGIELQQRGLHYLETIYNHTRQFALQRRCRAYSASLMRLQDAIRRKYDQLGNTEAAIRILKNDRDRVWRIEAATALADRLRYGRPSWLECRTIHQAMSDAWKDPDRNVRLAMIHLEHIAVPETGRDGEM